MNPETRKTLLDENHVSDVPYRSNRVVFGSLPNKNDVCNQEELKESVADGSNREEGCKGERN